LLSSLEAEEARHLSAACMRFYRSEEPEEENPHWVECNFPADVLGLAY
jgi:hypothetical protein